MTDQAALAEMTNDELKAILDEQGKTYGSKDNKATLIELIEADAAQEADPAEPVEEEKEPEVLTRTKTGRFPGRKANALRENGSIELHQVESDREGRGKWDYEIRKDGQVLETVEANYEAAKRRCRDLALEMQVAFDVKRDYHRFGVGPEIVD